MTISSLIGKNQRVLDLPCGTGYLCHFLDPSTEYLGWDLNHRFLKKLKKDHERGKVRVKKISLKQDNIFNFNEYPDVDIIVFSDILHHVFPNHIDLVENAKNHAKRIIVCEPVAVKPQDINARDRFFRIMMKFGKFLPEPMIKFLDYVFFDNDGLNDYENRSQWQHDDQSLKALYHSFGIKRIYNIIDDYIGVWEKNN